MDIQSLKLDLVSKILQTDKASVLLKIEKLFQKEVNDDWWVKLPHEIQESILDGIDDVQNGNTYSHDQIVQEAKQKYGF